MYRMVNTVLFFDSNLQHALLLLSDPSAILIESVIKVAGLVSFHMNSYYTYVRT